MARFDSEFTTWMWGGPALSGTATNWLWNDFWLQDELTVEPEPFNPDIVPDTDDDAPDDVEPNDEGPESDDLPDDPPVEPPEDPPEDIDDPTDPIDDGPEPDPEDDDPMDDGRDEIDPEDESGDDTPEDESDDEPDDEETGDGGGSEETPDTTPSPEDIRIVHDGASLESVVFQTQSAFGDPIASLMNLFANPGNGSETGNSDALIFNNALGTEDGDLPIDEFVFVELDPEPATKSLDDLALADLLPDDTEADLPVAPIDDWFM